MSITVVVLAAGRGTRMRSKYSKVLQKLSGQTLIRHVISTARAIEAQKIIVVHGFQGEEVIGSIRDHDITWVEQQSQQGTGDAVKCALKQIPQSGQSIILYGDVPLIQAKTLKKLHTSSLNNERRNLSMITIHADDPKGLGRIIRDENGKISAIVEEKDANEYQRHIKEVNTGIYCVDNALLHLLLPKLNNDNAQGEYYLTDIVALASKEGAEIKAVDPILRFETDGVNDRVQLARLENKWQRYMAQELLRQGVQLADPDRLQIRGHLACGQDVFIDTCVTFEGDCTLEDDVIVETGAVLRNVYLHAGAHIKAYSVIEDSVVGPNAQVGPFAHLRAGTRLEANTKVGNFVETKKTTLGAGSKASHLSYLGDAVIGENVNIGAGTITCNYDGVNKFDTRIEDGAFIGSNSSLVAPVTIGVDATVGAGSVITKSVEPGVLAVGRAKQVIVTNFKRPAKTEQLSAFDLLQSDIAPESAIEADSVEGERTEIKPSDGERVDTPKLQTENKPEER